MNMPLNIRRPAQAIAASLFLSAMLVAAGPAQAACVGGGKARSLVSSGEVQPLGSIVASLRQQSRFEIVGGELCERNGGYVYRLKVLGPRGKVGNVTVDARSGRMLGGAPF
jgi:hypothetical protein